MNTIRIQFSAPENMEKYNIDASVLNKELTDSGIKFSAFHDAHEAIVDCDPVDEQTVRQIIQAHIDNTEKRENNKKIVAEIQKLERQITPRRLRESVISQEGKIWLENIEQQIAIERNKLEII